MAVQLLVLLLGAGLLVRWAPELPLSRFIAHWLGERPARWLARRNRRELIAWAIMAGLIAFAGEYVLVIGGPQMALGLAVDLAGYIDALVAVATLASAARLRSAVRWLAPAVRRSARPRARRARRTLRENAAANDSEDRPARFAA